AMVKLSCASDMTFESGFCGLPDKLRGACASSASRIALSATAAGASTTDVPVSGCNGGIATSAGWSCCSPGVAGHSTFKSSNAPIKDTTTTAAPERMVRKFMKSASSDFANRSLCEMMPRQKHDLTALVSADACKHLVRCTLLCIHAANPLQTTGRNFRAAAKPRIRK